MRLCAIGDSQTWPDWAWRSHTGLDDVGHAAIGGTTSVHWLDWRPVMAIEPCDVYAIMLGTNDANAGLSIESYGHMMEQIVGRRSESDWILISAPHSIWPRIEAFLPLYRDTLLGICEANPNVTCVDAFAATSTADLSDGVHLDEDAQILVGSMVGDVARTLPEPSGLLIAGLLFLAVAQRCRR